MAREERQLKEHEFYTKLMGCEAYISIVHDSAEEAQRHYEAALAIGQRYEAVFTRFRPESELSQLNSTKHAEVSPLFFDMFMVARRLYTDTGGVFNPLLRADLLGYDRSFEELTGDAAGDVPAYDTDMTAVAFDEASRTITLREGQALDFGGFVKCHAAEVMAKSISGVQGVVVNIGGDLFTTGIDAEGTSFSFSVFNPVTERYPLALPAQNAAVATSGSYRRTWRRGELSMHHILQSPTDSARSDVVSATIIHPDGAIADGYATTAVVLGTERAAAFLRERGVTFALINGVGELIHNQTP